MKLQILSDLHLEFMFHEIRIDEDADVVVIAGDLITAHEFILMDDIIEEIQKPIIYVAGNHDYYHQDMLVTQQRFKKLSTVYDDFYFLDNDTVELDGVRFIGSTLWSNFDLSHNPSMFSSIVESQINDFSRIRINDKHFSGKKCADLNTESRKFLAESTNKTFDGNYIELNMNLNFPIHEDTNFDNEEILKNVNFLHYQGKTKPWSITSFLKSYSLFYQEQYKLSFNQNYHVIVEKPLRDFYTFIKILIFEKKLKDKYKFFKVYLHSLIRYFNYKK